MQNTFHLKAIIEEGMSAILCKNDEEAYILSDMVDEVYPGWGQKIHGHACFVNAKRYNGNFCVRIKV